MNLKVDGGGEKVSSWTMSVENKSFSVYTKALR